MLSSLLSLLFFIVVVFVAVVIVVAFIGLVVVVGVVKNWASFATTSQGATADWMPGENSYPRAVNCSTHGHEHRLRWHCTNR